MQNTFFPSFLSLAFCILSAINLSCGSKPTDLRAIIPADPLVYLETNDLGKALTAVTDNDAFKAAAKTQPDFSALAGMKLAVAVTGFETKEQPVTEENSILNFKPRFVAVAETNAWNYQALSFTENKLGEFINGTYGGDVTLETNDRNGGKYFTWTSQDGSKAYALVRGSLIFFGNDESAIEKCLAVILGEADSIAKNPKITALPPDSLASGHVSTDGIAQISNIVGLKFANEAGEAPEVQSGIASILPQLLRNSITEVSWLSTKNQLGIEDKLQISISPDMASVLTETIVADQNTIPIDGRDSIISNLLSEIPQNVMSVTRYNFKDPLIAWRSVLLVSQTKFDEPARKIIAEFSNLFFEPYGIRDPELFLSSVGDSRMGRNIVTVRLDHEGEEPVVIATRGGKEHQILKAMTSQLKPVGKITEGGINTWTSEDNELQVVFARASFGVGTKENLQACLFWTVHTPYEIKSESMVWLAKSNAPVATVTQDRDSAHQIATVFLEKAPEETNIVSNYQTEIRFNQNGIERRTVSDFGLIGSIIKQLGHKN